MRKAPVRPPTPRPAPAAQFHARLPAADFLRIGLVAARTRRSRNAVLQEAVADYLARQPKADRA